MKIFNVTVTTHDGLLRYTAIGASSSDVHTSALERFGLCGVTVVPAGAQP